MLSKLIQVSLVRAFSTANTPAVRSRVGLGLVQKSGATEDEITVASKNSISVNQQVLENERKHLNLYINEIKEELNDKISINFENEHEDRTLILQSVPDGTNTFKLGEVLVLGSAAGLWNLLLGFPSYISLVGVLGTGALGAVWSYSNYLKRNTPQITQIYKTKANQLQIHYLKPSGLFNSSPSSFTVDTTHFSHTSFANVFENYLRKSNHTAWVKVEGSLFWYNSNMQSLRQNNHHLI